MIPQVSALTLTDLLCYFQMISEQERDIHQQIDDISLTSSSIIDVDSIEKLMELQALGFATVNVSALATGVLSAIGSIEIEDLFMDLESMKAVSVCACVCGGVSGWVGVHSHAYVCRCVDV